MPTSLFCLKADRKVMKNVLDLFSYTRFFAELFFSQKKFKEINEILKTNLINSALANASLDSA